MTNLLTQDDLRSIYAIVQLQIGDMLDETTRCNSQRRKADAAHFYARAEQGKKLSDKIVSMIEPRSSDYAALQAATQALRDAERVHSEYMAEQRAINPLIYRDPPVAMAAAHRAAIAAVDAARAAFYGPAKPARPYSFGLTSRSSTTARWEDEEG